MKDKSKSEIIGVPTNVRKIVTIKNTKEGGKCGYGRKNNTNVYLLCFSSL